MPTPRLREQLTAAIADEPGERGLAFFVKPGKRCNHRRQSVAPPATGAGRRDPGGTEGPGSVCSATRERLARRDQPSQRTPRRSWLDPDARPLRAPNDPGAIPEDGRAAHLVEQAIDRSDTGAANRPEVAFEALCTLSEGHDQSGTVRADVVPIPRPCKHLPEPLRVRRADGPRLRTRSARGKAVRRSALPRPIRAT